MLPISTHAQPQTLSISPCRLPPHGIFVTTNVLHWHSTSIQCLKFILGCALNVVHSLSLDKFIITCTHHYNITQSGYTVLKLLCSDNSSLSPCNLWQSLIFFMVSTVLDFPECYIIGTLEYAAFSECFLSLPIMHLKFFHWVVWSVMSLSLGPEIQPIVGLHTQCRVCLRLFLPFPLPLPPSPYAISLSK